MSADAGGAELDVIEVVGDGPPAGASYGEACRPLIGSHLEMLYERASKSERSRRSLWSAARAFRDVVELELPHIAAEIDGIAAGARIRLEEAWLLQLRSEISPVSDVPTGEPECTSFGVTGPATETGTTIAGQNGDLPAGYRDLLVLVRRVGSRHPRYMTLTPAGQLSWHGMTETGLSVFANFLLSDGWRVGVPRYLFTRVALEQPSARRAADRLASLNRAASRNILLADDQDVLDIELAVEDSAVIEAREGRLGHTNHYVAAPEWERADGDYLKDSRVRLRRLETLLNETNTVDVPAAMEILRDRGSAPYTICRLPDDHPERVDFVTVASTIADVANRRLWIALGPPHTTAYRPYEVS